MFGNNLSGNEFVMDSDFHKLYFFFFKKEVFGRYFSTQRFPNLSAVFMLQVPQTSMHFELYENVEEVVLKIQIETELCLLLKLK